MRKFIALVLIAAIGTSFVLIKDQSDKSLANVDRVKGKYVFIYSEPVADYEVVGTINTSVSKMMSGQQSVDDQVNEMISRANKKVSKGKIGEYDAIVTEKGDEAILIKFKE